MVHVARSIVAATLIVAGFLAGVITAPSSREGAAASGALSSIVRVWQVVHPYSAPDKSGPVPLDCVDDVAPSRVISDVFVETSAATVAPFTFEFGQLAAARDGSDAYIWIEEVRLVAVPAGVSKVALIDQQRAGAGMFYFDARVADKHAERCVFHWT